MNFSVKTSVKFFIVPALALFAILSVSSAYALQVGDSASYSQVTHGKEDSVLVQVISTSADQYVSMTFADGSALSRHIGSISKYNQNLADILPKCIQNGGLLEAINTPAGHFNTCHQSKSGVESYLSPEVPFAVVKYSIHTPGVDTDKILNSFKTN